MSRTRTFGLTVAKLLVACLILLFALVQPALHGSAGQLPARLESRVLGLKEVNYYPAAAGHTYMCPVSTRR